MRRLAASELTAKSATVIADAAARDRVTAILAREAFSATTFECIQDMLAIVDETKTSAIVVWIQDTRSSIARLIEPVTKRFERTPVVVACPTIQRWEIRAALAVGVAGVVLDEALEGTLVPCLRAALAGQVCVPRANWRQIDPQALSARERQILALVAMGYMNSQIADQLFLAESTVKSHLSSVFGKLGVRSRNEAVDLVLDRDRGFGMGILPLGSELPGPVAATAR
jgi:DNA-binding NarL/FixJ family response regulator